METSDVHFALQGPLEGEAHQDQVLAGVLDPVFTPGSRPQQGPAI